jgi:hypothetical protein
MTAPTTDAPLVQAEITPEYAARLARERACAAHSGGIHLAFLAIECLVPGSLSSAEVEQSLRAVRKIVLATRTRPTATRKARRRLVNQHTLVQREATGQSSWCETVDQAIDAQAIAVAVEFFQSWGATVFDALDAAEFGMCDILARRIAGRLVSAERTARVHHAPPPPTYEPVRLPDGEPIPDRARPAGSPPGQERPVENREMLDRLRAAEPLVADLFEGRTPPVQRGEIVQQLAQRLDVSERQARRRLGQLRARSSTSPPPLRQEGG